MRKIKNLCLFFVMCCVTVFFVGCTGGDCFSSNGDFYYLVNSTERILRYEAYYTRIDTVSENFLQTNTERVSAALFPGDTLFLYSMEWLCSDPLNFSDPMLFDLVRHTKVGTGVITLKDDSGLLISFRRSGEAVCGYEALVSKERGGKEHYYNHFWTIDEAYIAEQSCNMTKEEFLEWQRETEGEQEE